jgi:hypothetical protein
MFQQTVLRGDSMKFRIWSNPKPSRPGPGPRGRARPALETLEHRTVLSFAGPVNLPVGRAPTGIVTADFNRDGIPDLVVTNHGLPDGSLASLSFLAGNGDGTFQPAVNFDVGPDPAALAVCDFDRDGIPDLAITHDDPLHRSPGAVTILLGDGDGTFRNAGDNRVGTGPGSVAVADFDHDGTADVVTANLTDGTVSVLPGHGDGSFGPAQTLPVGPLPGSVAVGDFAGDGDMSIVTADEGGGGSISLLAGNGDGSFQPAVLLPLDPTGAPLTARLVAVADLNGDGIPDLVTANDSGLAGGSVSVLLGNGDGSFRPAQKFTTGGLPLSVAVGDFHGDGRPDLVVSNLTFTGQRDQLSLLRGNGDGTFQTPVPVDTGRLSNALAFGDLNGDGTLDVAAANVSGHDVSILLGQGAGGFNLAPRFATGHGPAAVVSADFNGDGAPDLVTANTGGNSLSLLLGTSDGTFQPAVDLPAGNRPQQVVEADLNGDGIPDLAVLDFGAAPTFPGTISVLLGNGDGTFQPARTVLFHPGAEVFPADLIAGDFNGDGKPDLAVSETVVGGGQRPDEIDVLPGNGDGTFGPSVSTALPLNAHPQGMAVGDFNGDGQLDLAVTGLFNLPEPEGVYVLRGAGDGGFLPSFQFISTGRGPRGVAVGDFNGDGVPDLAVANALSTTVSVLLNRGDGTFPPPANFTVGGNANAVIVSDFNGDGVPDLATVNTTDNAVSVLVGIGDGTFQPETRYLVGSEAVALVAADFNGDGSLDLATANSASNSVTVLLQTGAGHDGPVAAAAGDLAGAGRSVLTRLSPPSPVDRSAPAAEAAVDRVFASHRGEEAVSLLLAAARKTRGPVGWMDALAEDRLLV